MFNSRVEINLLVLTSSCWSFLEISVRVPVRNESNTGKNVKSLELNLFCIEKLGPQYTLTVFMQNEVLTVCDQLALSPDEVCGLLVGDSCATSYNPDEKWNVTFPHVPKPPVQKLKPPQVRLLFVKLQQCNKIHSLEYLVITICFVFVVAIPT